MDKTRRLLIYGTGTLAEVAHFYFQLDSEYEVIGFVDMPEFAKSSTTLRGLPVYSWEEAKERFSIHDVDFFVAIGYQKTNKVRQMRREEIKAAGFPCATYISTRAINFSSSIGDNCFILENNVLQPFTEIGNNVILWSGNHLGHHSIVEDNCFIASQVVISGKCRIGANSFLGVNCCLHDGVVIGEQSVIGAGAIVKDSCDARSVFVPQHTTPRVIHRDII